MTLEQAVAAYRDAYKKVSIAKDNLAEFLRQKEQFQDTLSYAEHELEQAKYTLLMVAKKP